MEALRNEIQDDQEDTNPNQSTGVLYQPELFAEVTPGVFRPLVPPIDIPRYVICRLTPNGDGNYRLTPAHEWTGWMKLVDVAADCELPDISKQSLRRLMIAGFVDGMQPTPGIWYVNVDSLFEHMERTRSDDPDDSWWTPARKQAYAAAR